MKIEDLLVEIKLIKSFLKVGFGFSTAIKSISKNFPRSIFEEVSKRTNEPIEKVFEDIISKEKDEKVREIMEVILNGLKIGNLEKNLDFIIEKYEKSLREERESFLNSLKSFSSIFLIVSIILPISIFVILMILKTLSNLEEVLGLGIVYSDSYLIFSVAIVFIVQYILIIYFFRKWQK